MGDVDPQHQVMPRRRVRGVRAKPSDFLCGACGYDFTGLTVESVCPECGTPIINTFGQVKPTSGFAITSLVLGILSLITCVLFALPGLLLGPLAIVFWIVASNDLRAGRVGGASKGLAIAGLICGIVGSVLAYGFWALTLLGGSSQYP